MNVAYLKNFDTYLAQSNYLFDNAILNLTPYPQFDGKEFFSLGKYFESILNLPPTLKRDDFLKECVVEFDVSNTGIESIFLVKSAGSDLDAALISTFQTMSNKWSPLVFKGKVIDTRIKLTFSFSYQEF